MWGHCTWSLVLIFLFILRILLFVFFFLNWELKKSPENCLTSTQTFSMSSTRASCCGVTSEQWESPT